jgi:putative lipoprotein
VIVSGVIRFPSLAGGLTVRTLRVSIRTVAPADAPDTELAAAVVASDIVVPPSGTSVPFEIPVDLPTGTEVAVRAHADVTGTGRVQVGDLVSTARHLFPAPKLVVPLDRV